MCQISIAEFCRGATPLQPVLLAGGLLRKEWIRFTKPVISIGVGM
jgi:hypothetical protein